VARRTRSASPPRIDADLVIANTAPDDPMHRVPRDGVPPFERDPAARVRFEVASRARGFDLKPILDRGRGVAGHRDARPRPDRLPRGDPRGARRGTLNERGGRVRVLAEPACPAPRQDPRPMPTPRSSPTEAAPPTMPNGPIRTLRRVALRAGGLLAATPLAGCSWGAALASTTPADAREIEGLAYGDDPRQRLDLHVPAGASPAAPRPVAVFFYGGSWNRGDRRDYRFVGRALASRGIVAAVVDYRLYPQVRFPAFLHDGALAVAFLRREVAAHGGDPARLHVMGHSAGAYNAAMIALDPRWLAGVALAPEVLAGFVGLAGPYDFLPIGNPEVKPVFLHPDYPPGSQPIGHARGFPRPVFLGAAASDALVDPQRNTAQLARLLREAGTPVTERHYPRAGHATLVAAFAGPMRWIAPVLDDVVAFVEG
jgi:acetyl esterase/lipase